MRNIAPNAFLNAVGRTHAPAPTSLAALAIGAGLALCALGAAGVRDCVIHNGSDSMPRGFYLRTDAAPALGAIVTVRARDVAHDYARLRHFSAERDRFIKRVIAARGDVVCAEGETISINGETVARRRTSDQEGRALPIWTGCRRLADQVFLLGASADSFDGRYWGPIDAALIEGVWVRLD